MGHTVGGYSLAFFIPRPPVSPEMWDNIHFLWSIEHMAVVYDFKTIAGHNWYAWGTDLLVSYQNDDGSWSTQFRAPWTPDWRCCSSSVPTWPRIDRHSRCRDRKEAVGAKTAPLRSPALKRRRLA